jgi:hypothetical protein
LERPVEFAVLVAETLARVEAERAA